MLGVGEVLPFSPARRRAASLPVDVARTIEQVLGSLALDIVDVHEPFAPSASAVALRHSRALNVGSFHAPTERMLSTQLTRPLTRLLFARLDARIASYTATRNLLQRYFPGDYRVITPGADPRTPREPGELVRAGDDRDRGARGAADLPARAAAAAAESAHWHATVWSPRPMAPPATLGRLLRDRVTFIDASDCTEGRGTGPRRRRGVRLRGRPRDSRHARARARRRARPSVASRLPVYEEILADGERGLMFEAGEIETLATTWPRLVGRARAAAPQRRPRCGVSKRRSAGRGSPANSSTSTASSPRAGMTRSATARCASA